MDWEIDFETFDGLMMIRASGMVRVEGFREYTRAALSDPRWHRGTSVLLDFRDLDTDRVEYPDIRKIAGVFAPYTAAMGGVRVAVVVSRPQDYGLIKIWEVLAGANLSAHTICYTIEEALAFLRNSPEKGS
jgi:hypothetical protein